MLLALRWRQVVDAEAGLGQGNFSSGKHDRLEERNTAQSGQLDDASRQLSP